ncbi:MAG: Ppx/GppA family phosphatase [Francisellaceae bacterium]
MMMTRIIATIDLGSNSFHMLISALDEAGDLTMLYKDKYKVQLRAGLTERLELTADSQARALAALRHFAKAIKTHSVTDVKVIGTYTLRKAKDNIGEFLAQIQDILGVTVEVISGQEEARLVYVGASTESAKGCQSLVVDIGGGSTELVIGVDQKIKQSVSLEMGCVSMQRDFFADDRLCLANFSRAIAHAQSLILPYRERFLQTGWQQVLGSSGTIRAIGEMIDGDTEERPIMTDDLEALALKLLLAGEIKNIKLKGMRDDRINIIAGGFSVLYALFDSLGISQMQRSNGALREGMLYEFVTKIKRGDA